MKIYKVYIILFLSSISLSIYGVYQQVFGHGSLSLEKNVDVHNEAFSGKPVYYNPWKYRQLSEWALQGFISSFDRLPVKFVSNDELKTKGILLEKHLPYIVFRVVQNFIILWLIFIYFRKLKIHNFFTILLAWFLFSYVAGNSNFNSYLSFNTYTDIIFYLLAIISILSKKIIWIPVITIFAALNRETSGLIPLILLVFSLDFKNLKASNHLGIFLSILSLAIWGFIFYGLRDYYGWAPYYEVHGNETVLDYLQFNFTNFYTYPQLLAGFGLLPFITLLFYNHWPSSLKKLFWTIVPVWVTIHFSHAIAREIRLFLVPLVVVFIPAFILLIKKTQQQNYVKFR